MSSMHAVRIPYVLRRHETLCQVDDTIFFYQGLVSTEHVELLLDCTMSIVQHKFRSPQREPRFSEVEAINSFIEYSSQQGVEENSSAVYQSLIKALQLLLSKFDRETLDRCLNNKMSNTIATIDLSNLTIVQQLECVLEVVARFVHYKIEDHLPNSICSELLCKTPLFFTWLVAEPYQTLIEREALFVHNTTATLMDLIVDRFHTEHFIKRPSLVLTNLNRALPQFRNCTSEEQLAVIDQNEHLYERMQALPQVAPYLPNIGLVYFGERERVAYLFKHYSQAFAQFEKRFTFGRFEHLWTQVLEPYTQRLKQDVGEYDHQLLVYLTQLFEAQDVKMEQVVGSLEQLTSP